VKQLGAGERAEGVQTFSETALKLVWAHVSGNYVFAVTMMSATVERTSAMEAPASTQVAQTSRAVEVFMSLAEFARTFAASCSTHSFG
jgi:hypothetical protein